MSESAEQVPESDYTKVSVTDEERPEDLQPGEENPLAEPAGEDAVADGDPDSTAPDPDPRGRREEFHSEDEAGEG